ncbi:MAG: glycine cleavage system protein GcvH [Bacteroidales bacterium]|nr:glycine cleavage system protein GcvH [Bacteroidales bacterium]MCF8455031.1 glycine cleavage system protein GcvH [Bacteroidales bacterium]
MNLPADLKYTRDHEWVRVDGNIATVGITDYAQQQLGDIVFIEIETIDEVLQQGEVFGTIEAVKTVSDMFMPVSGGIREVNEELQNSPDLVNGDPYGGGWMIKIEMTNADGDLDGLLDVGTYEELLSQPD